MNRIQPEQISLQGELLGTWLMLKVFWKGVTLIQIHLVGIAKLSTLVQKNSFFWFQKVKLIFGYGFGIYIV